MLNDVFHEYSSFHKYIFHDLYRAIMRMLSNWLVPTITTLQFHTKLLHYHIKYNSWRYWCNITYMNNRWLKEIMWRPGRIQTKFLSQLPNILFQAFKASAYRVSGSARKTSFCMQSFFIETIKNEAPSQIAINRKIRSRVTKWTHPPNS